MSTREKQPRIRTVMLTLSNYTKWKNYILEQALAYGEPGKSLRKMKAIAIREPTREDRKHFQRDEIINEEEYVTLLNERIGDEDDIDAMNGIEDALRQEFRPVFRSDIQFEEAYKRYSRKLEEIDKETPKLISFILETISDDAKEKLLPKADYETSKDTADVILLWRTIEDVYDRQGKFSTITIREKYMNYKQGENSFDTYVTNFKEMLRIQRDLGINPDNDSIVIQFLIRTNHVNETWDSKIHMLMSTTPLPEFENVVQQLMDTKQLMLAHGKPHPDDVIIPNKNKRDVPALRAITERPDSTKVKDKPAKDQTDKKNPHAGWTCWNCDRKGHGGQECRGAKAMCTTCHQPGHLAKHHDFFTRITNRQKKGAKDVAVGKATVRHTDDDDDDDYGESLTRWNLMFHVEEYDPLEDDINDEDWEYDEDEDYTLSYAPPDLPLSILRTAHCECNSEDDFDTVADDNYDYMPDLVDSDSDEDNEDITYDVTTYAYRTTNATVCKSNDTAIIDSGAEEHITDDERVMSNIECLPKPLNVIGVGGHRTKVTCKGQLAAIPEITALLLPESAQPKNKTTAGTILSLGKIADSGRYFYGDREKIDIYDDKTDQIVMSASRIPPGFWTVDLQATTSTTALPATLEGVRDFTREQIKRFIGTRQLHCTLGHPSDYVMCMMLNNNVIVNCPYTCADVRGANEYLGPCQACKAGKIAEASAPTSMSPPATKVGDNVQADLIPLSHPTANGNNHIMILQDEFSGYIMAIGLPRKTTTQVRDAIATVNAAYRSQGHVIQRISTDAEPCFVAITNAISDSDEEADANLAPINELPDIPEEVSESEDEDNVTEPLAIKFPADVWRRRQTTLQNDDDKDIEAYPITYEEALKGEHADDADSAVDEELDNMERYNVWTAVGHDTLTESDLANIIPSGLYLKYKTDPASGSYIKSKARLHAGGHRQQASHYGETASCMINMMIVFIVLKVMSACNWCHAIFDIKGAFLHAPRVHPVIQYMRLSKALTAQWIKRHPEHTHLVHTDGCLYVRLDKALYGLKDSGYAWFVHLDNYLHSIGFTTSSCDRCMYFIRKSPTNFVYVLTNVDDLFVVGLGECFTSFPDTLRKTFPDFSHQTSDTFTYLGMSVRRDRAKCKVTINQSAYITSMLDDYGLSNCTPVKTPCATDFLAPDDGTSDACDKSLYLSIIMSLMYLARMSRPDILFPVTYLATKSANPTAHNLLQAKRILRYVKGTISLSLTFTGSVIHLCLYADASHGIYPDGKGHYGVVMMMGSDEVVRICRRIKCVTLSSTESEIVALVDAATYIRWLVNLFNELGIEAELPVTVYQDNQSAIQMINNGPNFKRTKHMTIKTSFAKALIDDGFMKPEFIPSEDMTADPYTKPMGGTRLVRYNSRIYCNA